NAAVAARFDRADTIANRDALRDRFDAARPDAARPDLSRAWDGARDDVRDATTGVAPERRMPDLARDAERDAGRVTMPPREGDRPMAEALSQDIRERAPEFRLPERAPGGEGGGFLGHFGGGRHRF